MDEIKTAWLAGFRASENGMNGENPGIDMTDAALFALVGRKFEQWQASQAVPLIPPPDPQPAATVDNTPFDVIRRKPGRPKAIR